MDQFIWHKFDANSIPLYNCSSQNLTCSEYTAKYGKPHPILGYIDIVYGIIIEILYLPCLSVMLKKDNIRLSCFKIMVLLGIIDMCAIVINSILSGYLMIEGAVFCSHPNLIYIAGSVGLGFWCSACFVCLILGLNRVLDILYPTLVKKYFAGHRTSFVLLIPIIYGLYFTIFTPAALFNSQLQAWFFDPFLFPGKTELYMNYPHMVNNLFIVIATCILYGYFCSSISTHFQRTFESRRKTAQRQIFIQSTIICMTNFIASMVYAYMNFFPVPAIVILMGHISWQIGHGCPAIIYICMNTAIRGGILKMFKFKDSKISHSRQAHPSTIHQSAVHSSSMY